MHARSRFVDRLYAPAYLSDNFHRLAARASAKPVIAAGGAATKIIASQGAPLMALLGIAKKIFGPSNERRLKPLWRRVEAIGAR